MPILDAIMKARRVMRIWLALWILCVAGGLYAQPTMSTMPLDFKVIHAYGLAELGRHGDAVAAFEQIHGPDEDGAALSQERSAYDRAMQFTQDCNKDQPCMADDLLAIGKFSDALHWQKQLIKSIHDGQKTNLRKGEERSGGNLTIGLGDETDSTSGKSVSLADAYDLQARIEAAMGQLGPALKDLDAAVKALPSNPKSVPREAGYHYHRALILAENRQLPAAVKACQESLRLDGTTAALGDRRQKQCDAIEALAATSKP